MTIPTNKCTSIEWSSVNRGGDESDDDKSDCEKFSYRGTLPANPVHVYPQSDMEEDEEDDDSDQSEEDLVVQDSPGGRDTETLSDGDEEDGGGNDIGISETEVLPDDDRVEDGDRVLDNPTGSSEDLSDGPAEDMVEDLSSQSPVPSWSTSSASRGVSMELMAGWC